MIERNHKLKTLRAGARQLRFEPLESRVQFAVDYLVMEPDAWLYQAPTTFSVETFASDYSSHWRIDSVPVLEYEWALADGFSLPELGSPLPTYDTNLDNSWFWDEAIGIVDSDPIVPSDLLGDTGISLDTSDISAISVVSGLGVPSTDSLGEPLQSDLALLESLPWIVPDLAPSVGQAIGYSETFWLGSTTQDQDPSVGPSVWLAIGNSDTLWLGITEVQFAPSVVTGTIVGQGTVDNGISTAFFRTGPGTEIAIGSLENISDSGLGSRTSHVRPLPITMAESQNLISSVSLTAVMLPWLQTPSAHELGGHAGLRPLTGLDAPSISKLDAPPASAQNSKVQGGASSRVVQPLQYLPLTAIASRLPIDVDLGSQLPVDGTAIVNHRSTSRGKAIPSAMVTDSVDAIANFASVGTLKNVLPMGMLSIGGEIGDQAVKIAQSHIANEHFVVQSLLICDYLRESEPEGDVLPSPTQDESLADSSLPKPSLSILLIGCFVAAMQTVLRPRTLLDSKLLGWLVVR